jgi:hypothetical protein
VSARELRPQVEASAANERAVVRDERDAPADCRGGDPQISVVTALVQSMADRSTLVSSLRDMLASSRRQRAPR